MISAITLCLSVYALGAVISFSVAGIIYIFSKVLADKAPATN